MIIRSLLIQNRNTGSIHKIDLGRRIRIQTIHVYAMHLILIIFLLVVSQNQSFAQKFSFGVGGSLGRTFAVQRSNQGVFKESGRIGYGINLPVRYKINERFSLISGLNLQRKTYTISHLEYQFPDLNTTGAFKYGVRNNVVQVPLLLAVKLWSKGRYSCYISGGMGYSYFGPWAYTGESDWTPQYSGNVLLNYEAGLFTPFNSTSGIELTSAVSFFIAKDHMLKHEFALGIDYSMFETPEIDYRILLYTNSDSKEYLVSESSKLLFLKFSYTRYLKFRKE